mmetsp:Transcript_107691/g.213995  ORF Transcript_107691/g.213995 Transcript_107691/m.213995 type:complete len:160 (-) Transcript_107691:97-576(-)|eukprot:CAMPEP_0172726116 /NCGR_PEP_ID=MMETSP1074-20121228/89970_1 /TAXON_ID=2916 /ORGANISM="Ceratium fusus, Strain PA161109" /LENGTH=159 /DNA_ID=CAMNT_0013553045 /DNA_START=96 /DNA_END=575 /DNA_ORIENTATION=+
MASIFRAIGYVRQWYTDLSLGEKGLVAMSIGNLIGVGYGTYVRRLQFKAPESDFLIVSTYNMPQEKRKGFENGWSDAARLAQRQPGYEWTRTYKALDWEDSPFHYLSLRMWNEEWSYRRFTQHDSTWKELQRRLDEVCDGVDNTVYRIVVDDSVKRIID